MKNKFVFLVLLFLIVMFPVFGVVDSIMETEFIQEEKIDFSGELMERLNINLFQEPLEIASSQAVVTVTPNYSLDLGAVSCVAIQINYTFCGEISGRDYIRLMLPYLMRCKLL